MDDATFDKDVEFIERASARYRDDLPNYLASGYDRIDDEVEKLAFLDHCIMGSEMRKDYWDAMRLIAQRQLRKGDPLPRALADWIKDVLMDRSARKREDKKRPRPAKGRPTAVRDQNMRLAVDRLVKRGFNATRRLNKMPKGCAKGGSACDVVAAAFGEDYKNTERICQNRKRPSSAS